MASFLVWRLGDMDGKFLGMETWRHGEDLWVTSMTSTMRRTHSPLHIITPFVSTTIYLGRKGNLGVFNPSDDTWRVLENPEPIYTEPSFR
jgi:hypothetical protein